MKDRWLPTSDSFKVVCPRTSYSDNAIVASLINLELRNRDVAKVRNMFLPHEAQVILGILISHRLPNDSLIWACTPNGKFTVKSAYKVAHKWLQDGQHKTAGGDCSDSSCMQGLWKSIWRLNFPNKIEHFMWRACLNILPTKELLRSRGTAEDGIVTYVVAVEHPTHPMGLSICWFGVGEIQR